ncbi:MAG: hypothetical protein WBG94_00185 [Anaerolineales bacterium]
MAVEAQIGFCVLEGNYRAAGEFNFLRDVAGEGGQIVVAGGAVQTAGHRLWIGIPTSGDEGG